MPLSTSLSIFKILLHWLYPIKLFKRLMLVIFIRDRIKAIILIVLTLKGYIN